MRRLWLSIPSPAQAELEPGTAPNFLIANTRAWRSAEIFMSEAGCRKALEERIEGPDLVMNRMPPARFGIGFALPGPLLELELPNPNTIHWGGGGLLLDFHRHGCPQQTKCTGSR